MASKRFLSEARELVATINGDGMGESAIDDAARALARKYHIGDSEVWDVLADMQEAAR
jgi:hypothetical protein